ncbi:DUF551 domain-containing protein [Burkholderia humptydooensis]|nr:DUF551 domain-containing protein [Burkholderia humptydooensis]
MHKPTMTVKLTADQIVEIWNHVEWKDLNPFTTDFQHSLLMRFARDIESFLLDLDASRQVEIDAYKREVRELEAALASMRWQLQGAQHTSDECPHGIDDGACKHCYQEATKPIYKERLTAAPAQQWSGEMTNADRATLIQALQKALAYWMPKVFDERSAHDAYLLVGYEGEIETRCWGDEIAATVPRWTPVRESLPTTSGWYLVMLKPDNDWGLMSDTPLQVEFDAYTYKPKAFTCLYDWRADEDITAAVTHWMPMPCAPVDAARSGDES